MPYKPKYCCQCGEKIEDVGWRIWDSHRYCKLCSSEQRIYDFIFPAAGFGSLLLLFFFSGYFQKSEKPLNVSPNQFLSGVRDNGNKSANQNAAAPNPIRAAEPSGNSNLTPVSPAAALKVSAATKPADPQPVAVEEKVYFCGAATKKGTPCSRRVRGGGRCWQHAGQTAMMAQEKLLVGN